MGDASLDQSGWTARATSAPLPTAGTRRFLFRVDGGEHAPRRARDLVSASVNGASFETALLDNVLLAVSEVVTNSVVHGGAGEGDLIELALAFDGPRVRIDVSDSGPGFPEAGPALRSTDATGGLGLRLVQMLSDSWGISGSAPTSVWFECSLSPSPQS